jgi:hypothetical protein
LFSKTTLSVRTDGTLALQSKKGSWNGGSSLNFRGKVINLNGAATSPASPVSSMTGFKLADTTFVANRGWTVQPGALSTIVTRAPTHEPYPYHNKGVNVNTNLNTTNTVTPTPPANTSNLRPEEKSALAVASVQNRPTQKPIDAENFVSEPPADTTIPPQN